MENYILCKLQLIYKMYTYTYKNIKYRGANMNTIKSVIIYN